MAKFAYKARRMNGALVEGLIDGDNIGTVRKKLSEQGLIPINVSPANSGAGLKHFFKQGVDAGEIVLFTKQFATLFRAGMGMEAILQTLANQATNPTMKETMEAIKGDIQEGATLSKAFGKHPKVFDDLYINMLATGEEAGILDEIMVQLSDVLEKDFAMRKGIKSAMAYPKIVMFVLAGGTTVLMIFVVPKFQTVFQSLGAELPLPTRIMIGTSDFMVNYWWIMIAGLVGIKFIFKKIDENPRTRFKMHILSFKWPVFGPLNLKVCNARFCNILACLYKSGLAVTKSLNITGKVIGNDAFMKDVQALQSEVEKGNSLAETMRGLKYFNPVVVEAMSIGEKTGSIDNMLSSIGKHYDMEIEHTIKNLETALEPILLGCIFGLVTVFALAIFLPMWGVSSAMLDKH